jgi:hypothetical protein
VPTVEAPAEAKSVKEGVKNARPSQTKETNKDPKAAPKEPAKEVREPVIRYAFFLRFPRGIRPTADPEARADLVYRYPRASSLTTAAGTGAKPAETQARSPSDLSVPPGVTGFIDAFLAFGNEPAAAFADKVVKTFTPSPVSPNSVSITVPERRDPLTFELREFNDGQTVWSVYAYSEGSATVAIIYRMEKSKKASLERDVELSLATLAIGAEANSVTKSYNDRLSARK